MIKRTRRYVRFKAENVNENGEFSGYAAVFGNVDLQDDIIERGAFRKTLRESKGRVPILDHHNPMQQIGWNVEAKEDDRGLFVRGQLNLEVQAARERHALMRQAAEMEARMGLSIGFRPIKDEPDRDRRVRRLMEIQLLEYSVVTFAANPEAFVTDVKDRACLIGQFLETEIGLETKTARDAVELLTPLLNPEPPEHSEDPGAGRQKPGDNNHVDVDGLKDSLVDLLSVIQKSTHPKRRDDA